MLLAHCVHCGWGYFQGMSDLGAIILSTLGAAQLPAAFWAFEGVLRDSEPNWSHEELRGVWMQARAVRAGLTVVDPALAAQFRALDPGGGSTEQPMPFLFQPLLLRLKREMSDYEQTRRLWEVCWAVGGLPFWLLVVVAYVQSQRAAVMRLPRKPSAMAELQQVFIRLVGTLDAAPLLRAARRLQAKRGVLDAVQSEIDR